MRSLDVIFDRAADVAGVEFRAILGPGRLKTVSRARCAAVLAAYREGHRNRAIRTYLGRSGDDVRYLRRRGLRLCKNDPVFEEWVRLIGRGAKGPRPKRTTNAERKLLATRWVELINEGLSQAAAARRLGIPEPTVKAWAATFELQPAETEDDELARYERLVMGYNLKVTNRNTAGLVERPIAIQRPIGAL